MRGSRVRDCNPPRALQTCGGFGFGFRVWGKGRDGVFIALIECFVEPFPVLGMCDVDQQLRPLFQVLSKEIDLSVFSDDPIDVAAGRYDAGAFFQEGNDA